MADEETQESETTKFLEAAKNFSFEQKLSVVQSILAKIPREQQRPWNVALPNRKLKLSQTKEPQHNLACGDSLTTDGLSRRGDQDELHEKFTTSVTNEKTLIDEDASVRKYQAPPLIDPYEKSMRYYEKHMVLNHFQHMTAKLVLKRPENTLAFMMNWCKEMQQKQEEERLKAKTLYEHNIDVYDEDICAPLEKDEPQTSAHSAIKL
ncbi:uncharacterized protein [Watersipora subatra]|uniref:uncharacterized protein n=1 Tax=Watersipora subatra TaxID=2589382 RepID=UPI00355C7952